MIDDRLDGLDRWRLLQDEQLEVIDNTTDWRREGELSLCSDAMMIIV